MKEIKESSEHNASILFSEKQKDLLTNRGFSIFSLRGESIAALKNQGVIFWSTWHYQTAVEHIQSRFSEVAINEKNPFLPHSAGMTILNQLLRVNVYSHKLIDDIPGVSAVIGSVADYVALEDSISKSNSMSLFRRFGRCEYATTTSLYELHPLFVGEFYDDSLVVSYRFGNSGYSDIKILPLIVPQN